MTIWEMGATGQRENRQSAHDGKSAALFLSSRIVVLLLVGRRIRSSEAGRVNGFHGAVPAWHTMQCHSVSTLRGLFYAILKNIQRDPAACLAVATAAFINFTTMCLVLGLHLANDCSTCGIGLQDLPDETPEGKFAGVNPLSAAHAQTFLG